MNLSFLVSTSWLKSPNHSGFRFAFRRLPRAPESVETRWMGGSFLMVFRPSQHHGFVVINSSYLRSETHIFLRSDIPFYFLIFLTSGKVFRVVQALWSRISQFHTPIPPRSEIGQWMNEWSPISEKVEKSGGKTRNSKKNAQKSQNLRTSGPTPVARGGSGAKVPPLAARPKQRWQAGFWLYPCVLRNSLDGSFRWFLCPRTTLYAVQWLQWF